MLYNLFENRDFVSVFAVALLAEGVDRNPIRGKLTRIPDVALLAEGVDRNKCLYFTRHSCSRSPSSQRAWIEICTPASNGGTPRSSPSSQRAWIEILLRQRLVCFRWTVALLAEGVDRNFTSVTSGPGASASPSSQRAWIEIFPMSSMTSSGTGRPPRRGRG